MDLDKTLLAHNSATTWVVSEFKAGRMSTLQALRGYYWIVRYQLGTVDLATVYRDAVRMYAGALEEEVLARTVDFYRAKVRGMYRPGARDALEWHRERGDLVVLLTSSSNYLSEMVSEELGLDGVICNRFEVDGQGRFTGRALEPLCVGDGKRVLAEKFAGQHHISMSKCTFYTDSVSDLPAMLALGHPVAVNPDPRLRREALARGWDVVDWGQPR